MNTLRNAIRAVSEFTKTTLIGGVLVVIPVYLTLILLFKMIGGLLGFISPVTEGLPPSLPFRDLIAVFLLLALCLFCGIAVRTRPGAWMRRTVETAVLEKLPGYSLMRGLAGRIAGKAEDKTFTVVLAEIEEALVPAFLVEDCDDENCTIFVPSVPTPAAGALYIIAKSRVHKVNIPFTHALGVISKWGAGSRELLLQMERK